MNICSGEKDIYIKYLHQVCQANFVKFVNANLPLIFPTISVQNMPLNYISTPICIETAVCPHPYYGLF